ncbi:3'-5' exonuclease [Kineococcus sp. SYSU DK004]|uniref:3'-5' exonuclease n=1 Tax=Kineococcus sp. SYSU DK004 TaxID=3383125 RepID=UPI003D7E27C6
MPQIVMGPNQTGALDASVKKQAYAFLEKLTENDALPGLHIEPINGSADDRVRTGRVNDFYRAVLFKLQGQASTATYVYLGVLPHDDAIAFAKKACLTVNPVNGIAELIIATAEEQTPGSAKPPAVSPSPPVADPDPAPQLTTAPEPSPTPSPLLPSLGLDRAVLVDDIGIHPEVADAALTATSEDDLLGLAERIVQWQGIALLDLASGKSVQDTKAALSIGDDVPVPAPETAGDERLIVALQHPAAKMQFAFIEDDEELRRAIEDDSFAAWRVFLHPEQRKYATASYNGPFRLSGGAGTGKTVVLLHRARHLARKYPSASILLTTFTKTLAEALRNDLRRLDSDLPLPTSMGDPGVYVSGIDAAVSAVLRTRSEVQPAVELVLGQRSSEIGQRTREEIWQDVAAVADELPSELKNRSFLVPEYSLVVLPNRVTTRDAYLTVRRPGRGVSLDRKKRLGVWKVVEAYRARASIDGSIDYTEAATIAAAALDAEAAAGGARPFDHVLVDEGQDLTPSHWQFLRALVRERRDDLFIAEDSHQRIYGQRVVLGRYGIRIVGRSQRLTLNYRTTAQNLHYAVGVLEGGQYVDLEEGAEQSWQYRSARSGPAPRVAYCDTLSQELDTAAEAVRSWLTAVDSPEAIGLLVRDAHQARQLTRGLEDRGIDVRMVDHGTVRPGQPLVMTMHRAKGMEFSRVLIFGVDEDLVPAAYLLKGLTDADRDDLLLRERSLLYVAATRARDELLITTGGKASAMLPALRPAP